MAKLGPIVGTITVSIGDTALPVKAVDFEVPLSTTLDETPTDGTVTGSVDIDRTELRKRITKTLRTLADRIEASFVTPGAVVLTCSVCGTQLVTGSAATLRHEAGGAHSLGPARLASRTTATAATTTPDSPA